MFEDDHVDPRWEEGRDYQLVCGLNWPSNLEKRDPSVNRSKSNRFLPWRVSQDDLGSVPTNPGDFCQFLDPDTDEWVLEEFMGGWWFSKTKALCGNSCSGKIANKSGQLAKAREKVHKPTQLADARSHRDPQEHSDWGRMLASKTNSVRWRCLDTGHISTAGPLTLYQIHRGIDPSLRERLG